MKSLSIHSGEQAHILLSGELGETVGSQSERVTSPPLVKSIFSCHAMHK